MASQGRPSRSGSKSRVSVDSGSSSLLNSWSAIATMMFGLIASYFGCSPTTTQAPTSAGQNSSITTQPDSGAVVHFPGTVVSTNANVNSTISSPTAPVNPLERDSILIGSFNIQMFGRAKMSRPDVVAILANIVQRFDILAIQELRDSQEGTITEFLRQVNANGSRYDAVVSPPIHYGTGHHSEQLVYIYDTDQIELLSQPYVAKDLHQVMFRPPYVAHFRYRSRYPAEAFSFVLMNIHTSPQQTALEFAAMESIFQTAFGVHNEDDFILLGDLNEEPGKYLPYRWMHNQYAAIPSHWKTNTAETKNYDNFVFDFRRTSEFTGQAGVLNLKTHYQLTRDQADLVSDHMPVWALFSSREAPRDDIVQQPSPGVIR